MGHLSAVGMADAAPSLEIALEWHLTHNHYPPVPVSMVGPCVEAIDAYPGDPITGDNAEVVGRWIFFLA